MYTGSWVHVFQRPICTHQSILVQYEQHPIDLTVATWNSWIQHTRRAEYNLTLLT